MSQMALSPQIEEGIEIEESAQHVWGENEGEVGLHITASVEPHEFSTAEFAASNMVDKDTQFLLSPVNDLYMRMLELIFRNAEELRAQLEEAENAIIERDEALKTLQKHIDNKNTEIDILENRVKVMQLEVSNSNDKKRNMLLKESNALSSECFEYIDMIIKVYTFLINISYEHLYILINRLIVIRRKQNPFWMKKTP